MNLYTKKQNSYGLPKLLWQNILIKIGILIFSLVLLNLFYSQIKNSFYTFSSPILKVFMKSGDGAYNFSDNLANSKGLIEENNNLIKQNQKLLSQVSLLQDTLKQNRDLNEVYLNTKEDDFKLVLVKVVGLNWASESLTVDKGTDDGIRENMTLISKEKVVYGRVIKSYKNFSEIILVSAKDSTFNVKIQSDDPDTKTAYGVSKGEGGINAMLDLVDFELEIEEGDAIVTSGLDGIFPQGLLVGTVGLISKSDLKPFQTAKINLFIDLKNIENLFVVTNYK